jgi:hypothetical protein
MIRQVLPLQGSPYCGDKQQSRVHDLNNEKPECCIDVIIRCGDAVPFASLATAHSRAYQNCVYCLGDSASQFTSE